MLGHLAVDRLDLLSQSLDLMVLFLFLLRLLLRLLDRIMSLLIILLQERIESVRI